MRPILARLELGEGFGPGPRVRPVPDRFVADFDDVRVARSAGGLALLDPGLGADTDPRVLITSDLVYGRVRIEASYARCVARAGGRPWLVPPGETDVDGLLDLADAVVLAGGAFDIHPRHYGQAVSARLDRVVEERTTLELALARGALARGIPILGVCGGMQALAVVGGGTLIQDLPAEPTHEQPTDPSTPWHPVALSGALAGWLGDEVQANSTHHQAVDRCGPDFEVAGRSPDGVIEAIAWREHPFAVGVQWHPERLGDARLYEALIGATRGAR